MQSLTRIQRKTLLREGEAEILEAIKGMKPISKAAKKLKCPTDTTELLGQNRKNLQDSVVKPFLRVDWGIVKEVAKDAVAVKVKIKVEKPVVETAIISKAALKIWAKAGDKVDAIVKATEVMVARGKILNRSSTYTSVSPKLPFPETSTFCDIKRWVMENEIRIMGRFFLG